MSKRPAVEQATTAPWRPLAERIGRAFSTRACVLGYGIFVRGGAVMEQVSVKDGARFVVGAPGKRKRTVALRAAPGALEVACSCSPEGTPLSCRHVWAAVLMVDRDTVALGLAEGPLALVPHAQPAAGASIDEPCIPKEPPRRRPAKMRAKKASARATTAPTEGASSPRPSSTPSTS